MNKYYIYTDSGSQELEANTVEEAIEAWGKAPKWVKTVREWEKWLGKMDAYGAIQENDIEIARVNS